jgi:hypothetical protein
VLLGMLAVIASPVFADEIKGTIKSVDKNRSEIVITGANGKKEYTISYSTLAKGFFKESELKNLVKGKHVTVDKSAGCKVRRSPATTTTFLSACFRACSVSSCWKWA